MQPGEFNKLRNQGAFDSNHFWDSSCQNRFGVSAQQIKTMRQNGGSHESILGSCVVGKLSKEDPQTIYQQFQDQRSWTTITRQNSVRFESWRRVSQPDRDSNRVSWSGKKIKPGAWTRVSPAKQKHRPIKARTDNGHGKPDKVKADNDQKGHGQKQKGDDSKSKSKGKGKSKGR